MSDKNVKDYLYSLLTEEEKSFLSTWLKNNKEIPFSKEGEPYSCITAEVKIIVDSAVTNVQH